jgi:hypothetical protein
MSRYAVKVSSLSNSACCQSTELGSEAVCSCLCMVANEPHSAALNSCRVKAAG